MLSTRTWVWLEHAAVAIAYAFGYELLSLVSFPHWVLFAGLRLGALLFVPVRFWPALAVGEMGPLAYIGMTSASQWGWAWSASIMVPPIALAMPLVHWGRRTLHVFPQLGQVRMGPLLLIMFGTAVIDTLINLVSWSLTRFPLGYKPDYLTGIAGWLIGNFLGVLTLVPLAICLHQAWQNSVKGQRWGNLLDSRLLLEGVSLLVPALALLAWLSLYSDNPVDQQTARMAMFLPVVVLALRHGWQGAAVGGSAASFAIGFTMAKHDASAAQAEVFIAFAITTMLLLGSRISTLNWRERQHHIHFEHAMAVAQRNIHVGELQLRQAARVIDQIRDTASSGYAHLVERRRHRLDDHSHQAQSQVAEQLFHLSDSLYPTTWDDRGLRSALREGSIARALSNAGIVYWCDQDPGDWRQLSEAVHIALYRVACECVLLVCEKNQVSHISFRLRTGAFHGRPWAVLCVDSVLDPQCQITVSRYDLRNNLAAAGLGFEAIKDRVDAFDGQAHRRILRPDARLSGKPGERISVILHGPEVLPLPRNRFNDH